MAKTFIIFFLYLSSVWADTEIKSGILSKTMDDATMVDSAKLKRDSWPIHATPCPPFWPHHQKGWVPEHPKVQFVHQTNYGHKPALAVIKPHVPSYHTGWHSPDPWQQNVGWNKYGWNKPSHGWPMSSGWQYPGWQPKIVVQKPVYSYAPQYQKPAYHVPSYHHPITKPTVVVKPDCPPYEHHQSHHTGIVYAPQHQYHQPQIVKVVKPDYHHPAPVYHNPAPVYHHPAPVYHRPLPTYNHPVPVYNHHIVPSHHHPSPVHISKVEICNK